MLLDVQGRVTPDSNKTHIVYAFYVPPRTEKLHIFLSYAPKRLEDVGLARKLIGESLDRYVLPEHRSHFPWESFLPLQNLITVSADDPEKFRGASHSHEVVQEHVIGETASPGFVDGPVPSGMWRVWLSLHNIVTPTCDYVLRVW